MNEGKIVYKIEFLCFVENVLDNLDRNLLENFSFQHKLFWENALFRLVIDFTSSS
jgi:hypothetical protein